MDLENEIALLEKYRLNPTELFFIKVLLILQDENKEDLFAKYLRTLKLAEINIRKVLQALQEKGIILKSYTIPCEGCEFNPYEIELNKNFIKTFYKCSFELGKELFEEYPQFGSIQGNIVGLRSISKKFDSLEHAYFHYGKSIGWNPERHKHIIELVKWAKEHNIINYTLMSFIVDQRWLELEALQAGNIANIDFDSVKLL